MPSFLQMYKATGVGMDNIMQRWWLEPKYESVLRSPDGLAWEFNGASVKCMTEEDFATANGQREHTGKPSAVAQKWADNMTRHYDELAVAEPVFGELRNCMQLALVGALVAHERLADKAGCNLPALMQESTLEDARIAGPHAGRQPREHGEAGPQLDHQRFGRRQHSPRRDRRPGPREFRSRRSPRQGPQRRKVQLVLELNRRSMMATPHSSKISEDPSEQPSDAPSFEQTLGRLEEIVHLLEEGKIGLDEALGRYEEGVGLLRKAYELLETAQRRISLLSGVDSEGNPDTPADGGCSQLLAGTRSRRPPPATATRKSRAAGGAGGRSDPDRHKWGFRVCVSVHHGRTPNSSIF